MRSPNVIHSIITMRCPRCRDGKMFPSGTLYSRHFMKMNERCSCCGQSFMPEPGYYFGAMFVSYAINAAFFIAVWLGMDVFMDEITISAMIIALLVVVFGLLPITFRFSRVLWIYIFIRYNRNIECKDQSPSSKYSIKD